MAAAIDTVAIRGQTNACHAARRYASAGKGQGALVGQVAEVRVKGRVTN